jgi:NADH-quinone oxidoreductase subunit N
MKWKRFLAFSSIANVGNLLLALSVGGFHGIQATWLYVIIYGLSVLRVWLSLASIVKIEPVLTTTATTTTTTPTVLYTERPIKYIHELGSLVKTNTVLAYTIAAAILASAGLPPFVMFQAKLSVILAAVSEHRSLLALYMVLISVLTTFYYLRFVKILFFTTDESSDRTVKGAMTPLIATIISLLSISMLLLMLDSNLRTGVTTWMTTSSGLVQ